MEVIHEDFLERCIPNGSKKDYKKAYFVFRQDDSGCKTLEYFKDSNWKKSEPRGVCNLFNGYSVRPLGLHETKKKFGLLLTTVGKQFELHASSEKLKERWIEVLNTDLENLHYAKLLESPPNAFSFFQQSGGLYHLQITDTSVILFYNRVSHIVWRFGTIRRYKSIDGAFVLEVGRKAPTGEGIFRFQVADSNSLFDELDKALKRRMAQKRNEDSSVDSNRSASFDGGGNRRSVNIRAMSTEDGKPLPPDPPSYNTLDNVNTHTSTTNHTDEAGYDRLFSGSPPSQPTPSYPNPMHASQLFQNKSIIGHKVKTEEVSDENYIDMSGMKEEIINESRNMSKLPGTKPRPLPRPPSNASVLSSSPSSGVVNRSYRKSDIDLIDLSTYNCPSPLDLSTNENDVNEYHHLNNHTPPKTFDTSVGYDHLNQMNKTSAAPSSFHPNGTTENVYGNSVVETYDSPKSLPNNHSSDLVNFDNTAMKPLPPPIPSRPFPPSRSRPKSDQIGSSKSDTVHVLKSPVSQDIIYDSPRSNLECNSVAPLNNASLNKIEDYQVPPRSESRQR